MKTEYAYPVELAVPEHSLQYPSGTLQIEVACFRAGLSEPLVPTLNGEHDAYRWCTFDEARQLFRWPVVEVAFREVVRGIADEPDSGPVA